MSTSLGMITIVVRGYDEAIAYYTGKLGFSLIEDTELSASKRWVVVAPSAGDGARLLLAQAQGAAQEAAIGRQAGGRVLLFLYTDAFDETYARYQAAGVHFVETPRAEAWGKVVVFEDMYGNRWDLIERQ